MGEQRQANLDMGAEPVLRSEVRQSYVLNAHSLLSSRVNVDNVKEVCGIEKVDNDFADVPRERGRHEEGKDGFRVAGLGAVLVEEEGHGRPNQVGIFGRLVCVKEALSSLERVCLNVLNKSMVTESIRDCVKSIISEKIADVFEVCKCVSNSHHDDVLIDHSMIERGVEPDLVTEFLVGAKKSFDRLDTLLKLFECTGSDIVGKVEECRVERDTLRRKCIVSKMKFDECLKVKMGLENDIVELRGACDFRDAELQSSWEEIDRLRFELAESLSERDGLRSNVEHLQLQVDRYQYERVNRIEEGCQWNANSCHRGELAFSSDRSCLDENCRSKFDFTNHGDNLQSDGFRDSQVCGNLKEVGQRARPCLDRTTGLIEGENSVRDERKRKIPEIPSSSGRDKVHDRESMLVLEDESDRSVSVRHIVGTVLRAEDYEMLCQKKKGSERPNSAGSSVLWKVNIFGVEVEACVDTGSVISIISAGLMDRLRKKGLDIDGMTRWGADSEIASVTDASGTEMEFIALIRTEMVIDGSKREVVLHVQRNSGDTLLLGTNILDTFGCCIEFAKPSKLGPSISTTLSSDSNSLATCESEFSSKANSGYVDSYDTLKVDSPKNMKELRNFLSFAQVGEAVIWRFAELIHPLYELCESGDSFSWHAEHEKAFHELKNLLLNPPTMTTPDLKMAKGGERPFILFAEVGQVSINAALAQENSDGVLNPLCYASRKVPGTEKVSFDGEKEAFGVVWALRKFRWLTRIAKVIVRTENPQLAPLFVRTKGQEFTKWSLKTLAYDIQIEYANVSPSLGDWLSDWLSKPDRKQVRDGLAKDKKVVYKIERDDWLSELKLDPDFSDIIQDMEETESKVWLGFVLRGKQLTKIGKNGSSVAVVPESKRRKVFDEVCQDVVVGKFQAFKVFKQLSKIVFWEGMRREIMAWCRERERQREPRVLVRVDGVHPESERKVSDGTPRLPIQVNTIYSESEYLKMISGRDQLRCMSVQLTRKVNEPFSRCLDDHPCEGVPAFVRCRQSEEEVPSSAVNNPPGNDIVLFPISSFSMSSSSHCLSSYSCVGSDNVLRERVLRSKNVLRERELRDSERNSADGVSLMCDGFTRESSEYSEPAGTGCAGCQLQSYSHASITMQAGSQWPCVREKSCACSGNTSFQGGRHVVYWVGLGCQDGNRDPMRTVQARERSRSG